MQNKGINIDEINMLSKLTEATLNFVPYYEQSQMKGSESKKETIFTKQNDSYLSPNEARTSF